MSDQDYNVKELQNGPISNRSCTDLPCCCIFILAQIGFLLIAVQAFTKGDPNILSQPYDMNHQPCGINGNEKYPLIYFPKPTPNDLKTNICIESCPQKDQSSIQCLKNDICKTGEFKQSASDGYIIYESKPVYNKICIPMKQEYFDQVSKSINVDKIEAVASDLRNTWMICSFSSILAIMIGFLFMIVIRCAAGSVIWLFIIIIQVTLTGLGVLFLFQYKQLTSPMDLNSNKEAQEVAKAMSQFDNKDQCFYTGIILLTMAVIFLLFICCSCERIRLCTQIIKAAARFIMDNPRILMVSIIAFVVSCLFFAYWFLVAVYLYSSGGIKDEKGLLPFAQVNMSDQIKAMGWTHLFSLFWCEAFISASMQFIIIGAVAYWYFQTPEIDDSHTTMSAKLYFGNHMGTAAFGSFILGIIGLLKVIVESINYQAEEMAKAGNQAVLYIAKCLKCCIYCLDECIKKINQNAYIQTVITGKNFCSAAASAMSLIALNPARLVLVSGFGHLFEILGNLAICGSTSLICYQIITQTDYYKARVDNPFVPVFVISIVSFYVGSFLMGLFSMAGETLIVIFCIEENGGKSKSKKCPQELIDFMEN